MIEKIVQVRLQKPKVIRGSVELAGAVVSVPESVARRWITKQHAVAVETPAPVEEPAASEPVETRRKKKSD